MDIYTAEPVIEHLTKQGLRLRIGVRNVISEYHLEEYVQVLGRPCNLIYVTRDQQKNRSQEYRTLFLQELIKRGVIALHS